MLFNSFEFIFCFLPITLFVYFFLLKIDQAALARPWLLLASLFFYSWWNIYYLPLLSGSILVNFFVGRALSNGGAGHKKKLLFGLGISFNVGLLAIFKYSDFVIANINTLSESGYALWHLALPLAISFFTFQQIAYLADSYRGETEEKQLLDYALFVSFFPQLIAGPIVHHKQMMPQFASVKLHRIDQKNISLGLLIFAIGFFKKTVIADQFSAWVAKGFDLSPSLSFVGGWCASLSFSFQLYFDFSGYADMAIGAALLFNIHLPLNFNSPYKSASVRELWTRWHITLGDFLKRYIYFSLGGNKRGYVGACFNLFLTFVIAGIWHGAGWTFVIWGFMHGTANVINKIWNDLGYRLPYLLAWFITFNFINVGSVFFRAKNYDDAIKVLEGMSGVNGLVSSSAMHDMISTTNPIFKFWYLFADLDGGYMLPVWLLIACYITFFTKSSMQIAESMTSELKVALATGLLLGAGLLATFTTKQEFLYFQF